MDIGRLSCQVTLQRPPSGADAQGDPSGAWTDVTTLWAEIKHLSGLAILKAGADASIVKASIRIRWRDGVTAGMRIRWGSTSYRIDAVLPGERRKYIDLPCTVVA